MYIRKDSIGENEFPFVSSYQLEVASGLVMGRVFTSSDLGSLLTQTCAGPVRAASLRELAELQSCCLAGLVSTLSSIPSDSYKLFISSYKELPEPRGDVMETFPI